MTSTYVNPSSIALAERYAREHFGLSLPLTSEDLKSAFRRRAKELHTDTSGDERTKFQFIAMKDAYDFLVKLDGMEFVYGEKGSNSGNVSVATIDGTPLYELGLGLGPMRNGRDCERCNHRGYTEEQDSYGFLHFDSYCYNCDSSGRVLTRETCRACKGTGKFKQERSGHVVTCRVCSGVGKHPRNMTYSACPECEGKGRKEQEKKTRFAKCYECSGTGEIELFSPLLPKGRLINKVTRR